MKIQAHKPVYKILVVDDDAVLNELICSFLKENFFSTVSASGVEEAIGILRQDAAIDLVLLDFQLHDGVGMDVMDRAVFESFVCQPPVIIISSNEDPIFLQECFDSGVADYIIKPVNLSLLVLKVQTLIKSTILQRKVQEQKLELEKFKRDAEREENLAKFTYQYLLNHDAQKTPGLTVWLESYSSFSGDMALVRSSPGGSLYFILADATGHGLSAAITIMPVVTIFNSMVSKGFHIQQIVNEINKKLVSDTPADRFVAAILVEINPLRQEVCVWNGGMPTAYWVKNGEILHEFGSRHMPLGILDADLFEADVVSVQLPDDGFIFSYSDGLTEQTNFEGNAFGLGRVKDTLKDATSRNILDLMVDRFSLFVGEEKYKDDISLCIVDPEEFFAHQNQSISQEKEQESHTKSRYELSVKVTGAQLENCELPPLCNQFLHHVGLDHQFCQRVFTVVAELVSNAIDHGVLRLNSQIKDQEDGFMIYFQEREYRLKNLSETDAVELSLSWNYRSNDDCLVITVADTGSGYDLDSIVDESAASGRGLKLIKQIAHEFEVISPGNVTRVVLK